MKGADAAAPGATYNDGKTGVAYMEERIFGNFVQRLQTCVEETMDAQFKTYLQVTGINIDSDIFRLKLVEPQNFDLYRQAALDTDMIQSFNSIEPNKYLSRRFILKRYLGLTEDDIQMNEAMLKQERNIADQEMVDELQQIYDPAVYENRKDISVEAPPEEAPPEEGAPEDMDLSTASEPPPEEAPAA
jgi:hypothetical protein